MIIDFGAARQTSGGKSTVALLTPRYSAVEQYASQEDDDDDGNQDLCGPFTDIYSLAATFYFIIKGRPPQDAPSRILNDSTENLQNDSSLSHYSNDFLNKIDWGMAPIPQNRPQSVQHWLKTKVDAPKTSAEEQSETKTGDWKVPTTRSGPTPFARSFTIAGIAAGMFLGLWSIIFVVDEEPTKLTKVVQQDFPAKSEPKPTFNQKQPTITRNAEIKEPTTHQYFVGIDPVGWTSLNVVKKLEALGTDSNGSFQLKIHANEPFRVRTEKGLAITKTEAENWGETNGEVYLKSVNGAPQRVRVLINKVEK